MTTFSIEISGDRQATLRLASFPDAAYARLVSAMERIEARLEMAVLAAEPNRTGALRALTGGQVYHDNPNRVAVRVGVRAETQAEAEKAAALEYGSRGTAVSIAAHKASLDHFWARAVSPIVVQVGPYSRTPAITARRFLRGPIDMIRTEAFAEMRAALDAAATDGT